MTTAKSGLFTVIVATMILIDGPTSLLGQTNLQFTGISVTDEGAMHINWASLSNEVYEIDEADALIDTNTGSITWNKLYENYPSQGTNTFWLDAGNYNFSPQILHPKNTPMRFYRVVDNGPDSASDEPTVSITSPSSNTSASAEMTVTVSAVTDQPVISGTKLYVDGQEMRGPTSSTNWLDSTGVTNYEVDTYSLNTCEWGNEVHTMFATVECQSGNGDAVNSGTIANGHGVSPFVPVLFSNLVTRIAFSQPSFDPFSGQTQQVSAVFAANSNWTLKITDAFSNMVFTTTGSGNTMAYNWNGTGTGGTNLPTGIYYYYITAATNGEVDAFVSIGSSGGGSAPPSLSFSAFSRSETEWYVTPSDGSGGVLPLAMYPPGFDTNDLTIFEASPLDIASLRPMASRTSSVSRLGAGGGFTSNASGGGGSSSPSQTTPAAPQRTPSNPVVGISGLFQIEYDTYSANGTNVMSAPTIPNVPGVLGSYIALDGYSGSLHLTYAPLVPYKTEANNFVSEMQTYGWQGKFKADDQIDINDLRGSGTSFNNASVGALLTHGSFGNTQDYMAGLCKQMYFPITSGGSINYLRMSEMSLGGSDATNGLKWFAFVACDSLHQANWNSMKNMGRQCYNSNMHEILGANSVITTSPVLLQYWARYMNYGRGSLSPMTVSDAWIQAAKDAFRGRKNPNTMVMAVASDSNCTGDYIEQGFNSAPGGTWGYTSVQVWP